MRLWDAGVDWLTMTFEAGHKDYVRTMQIIDVEMKKAACEGHEILPFTWNGYSGVKQGKLAIGQRHDGMMLRVSGTRARQIAQLLKEKNVRGKATRIDFQATGKEEIYPQTYINRMRPIIEAGTGENAGRHASNTALYKNRGRATGFTIGSRSSERYQRLYDKSAEQRGKVERGLIRCESECKGKRAAVAWNMFLSSAQPYYLSLSIVKADFEAFGVDMGWLVTNERAEFPSSYEPVTVDRQLGWLAKYVRPTVLLLVEKIGRERVLEALGLDLK